DRYWHAETLDGGNHTLGQDVAAQDTAEDINQHCLDVLVGHQDAKRILDLLGVGSATNVEEVCWLASGQLDDVHGRHREPGAVDHAPDGSIELDVVQRELRGFHFERLFLAEIAQFLDLRMTIERVVVEVHLGVERKQGTVF